MNRQEFENKRRGPFEGTALEIVCTEWTKLWGTFYDSQ
jgi:hypothetical protein